MSCPIEGASNRTHLAICHRRGSDDITACFRKNGRLLGQHFESGVIVDLKTLFASIGDDPTVAMVGEFAEANICDDEKIWRSLPDLPNCPGNHSGGIDRTGASGVLLIWNSEQEYSRNSCFLDLESPISDSIGRVMMLSGQGIDGAIDPNPVADK
jgi:hypothetical protein